MKELIEFILHAENHLRVFIEHYGAWVYALLFLIIFCETGLVILPFLPGDSLLFAVGALAAQGMMDLSTLTVLLITAAILGDTVNYSIGSWVGPKVFHDESNPWFRKDHLMRAHAFYEKYGGKAIVLARFVPIVRTFAPFVAGVGTMSYSRFLLFNLVGAILWIGIFLYGGYFLGNLEVIKSNFKFVTLLIVVVSVLPIAFEFWAARKYHSPKA